MIFRLLFINKQHALKIFLLYYLALEKKTINIRQHREKKHIRIFSDRLCSYGICIFICQQMNKKKQRSTT